jgi:starch synthase (maltosyl-transferring)
VPGRNRRVRGDADSKTRYDRGVKAPARTSAPPPTATPPTSPPHVVIEPVHPLVDGGRHPIKRLLNQAVQVEANVYKEGHDAVAARVCYRGPGDGQWRTTPMSYDINFDRCRGSFVPDRLGRWMFTVEAWTDRFATWRADFRKRLDARQDLSSELLEAAALVADAARHARGTERTLLEDAARRLRDPALAIDTRAALALDTEVARLVDAHLPPDGLTRSAQELPVEVDAPRAGFAAWYEMFPRSQSAVPGRHGTFADAARSLPRLAELGFDVVYLPPIHPIGHTHRKGPNNSLAAGPDDPGSPWAIGSEHGGHTAIDPRLGTLEDFDRFVKAASSLGLEIALDYALQCSPDHPWTREHPEWFFVRPDGTIKYAENPPKKYEDIYPLNFWCDDWRSLWSACGDIFRFWIGHGVRSFRVDNPHTKPFAFWEWVIADIRRDHPDVVFFAEAFTRPARMYGLAKLGFTQSYSYFTWRNTPWEVRDYLTELTRSGVAEHYRPNFFVNTPDILHDYLQRGGRPAYLIRLVLAGTLSPLYGMYSGYELCENVPVRPGTEEPLHSEKYEIVQRRWETTGHIGAEIMRLNRIRRENPALQRFTNLEFLPSENDQILWYRKHVPGNELFIAVNLDPHRAQQTMVHVPLGALGLGEDMPFEMEDLLTGARYTWRGTRNFVRLDPTVQVAHILRAPSPVVPA